MKVFKLKSSPDNNPIFGRWSIERQMVQISSDPQLLPDANKIGDFMSRGTNWNDLDNWELVEIKITIER